MGVANSGTEKKEEKVACQKDYKTAGEEKSVSDKEKKIIESVAAALPNMSERQKGYFLGYAEAIEELNQGKEEQQEETTKPEE